MIDIAAVGIVVLAFAISLIVGLIAWRVAARLGFVAVPRNDRYHSKPTPLLGGSAIFAAILLPSLAVLALANLWHDAAGAPAWLPASLAVNIPGVVAKTPGALAILGGALALHIMGLIDDRRRLGPYGKLIFQVLVATAVVLGCNLRLLTMFGEPWSSLASVAWLVLITNAFNFLDNVDGLAAGVAAICAGALLVAAAVSGQLFVGGWLCLLLGGTLGFLVLNFPPARLFMGDAGSLILGYFLGVLTIQTTYYRAGASGEYYGLFVPVVLLAVPLYDTISVITLRLAERRNPMIGDTRHFSHRLLRRGLSPRQTVLVIYLATAATALGAARLPTADRTGAMLVFAQTLLIVLMIALMEWGQDKSP